jgi:hypothetical protein
VAADKVAAAAKELHRHVNQQAVAAVRVRMRVFL